MHFKKRCYFVYCLAPEKITAKQANDHLNTWIQNQALGIVIYHEHFVGKPLGGIAVFEVTSKAELERLYNEPQEIDSPLYGWRLCYHPLIHSTSTERFIYQTQYTLATYRGITMKYQIDTQEE